LVNPSAASSAGTNIRWFGSRGTCRAAAVAADTNPPWVKLKADWYTQNPGEFLRGVYTFCNF
jgi:hypothetical protein